MTTAIVMAYMSLEVHLLLPATTAAKAIGGARGWPSISGGMIKAALRTSIEQCTIRSKDVLLPFDP